MPTLIQDTAELKQILGVQINKNYSNNSIVPVFEQCEQEHIIELLGQEQYDDLINNIGSLNVAQTKLLKEVQKPLAYFVYCELIRSGQIQTGDAGTKETNAEQTSQVRQWVLNDALKTAYQKADRFSDYLLAFLDKNKTDYPLWNASEASVFYKEYFISNTDEFEKYQKLSKSRRLFKIVAQEFDLIEIRYIVPTISQELFDELKNQIANDSLTPENKVLLGYIKKAVAPLALMQAIPYININISVGGIHFEKENTGVKANEQADQQGISFFLKNLEDKGQEYIRQLKKFLNSNPEKYPIHAYWMKNKNHCKGKNNDSYNGIFVL
jgi:hypothetical protein